MIYDIENKNDLSGAMLVIRFPEEDLDRKALYTIERDQPPFLVPFSYRSVNGMAECTYRLGSRSKLQYRFGAHSVPDYVSFWNQVLQPLLDCDDWFLKPFSFVLDSRYLYADKSGGTVSYLYVPSRQDCESFEALRTLVLDLSQQNSVTDAALENKVLRAIMQDFQPKSFLTMLRAAGSSAGSVVQETPDREEKKAEHYLPENLRPQDPQPAPTDQIPQKREVREDRVSMAGHNASAAGDGEIHINFGGAKRDKPVKEKPVKEHKPLFGGKKEKPAKERKPLFGGKKEKPKEVILGAAAELPDPAYSAAPACRSGQIAQPAVSYEVEAPDGATQLMDEQEAGVCRLRLVGDPGMPREIAVDIPVGRSFTIGRFDVSVGQKQSDFEFEKSTKAVSRRHAAIEREETGYFVVDLASSAGTFVDGLRLIPNVPQRIDNGSRISFGTGGADYIWVE